MDLGADPVHGEADEAHAHVGVEALDRFHEPDVAFLNQVADGQAVTEIAARDVHHEAQVRQHEIARRVEVLVLAEAAGEREFRVAIQHRDRRDALDVRLEAADRGGQDEGGVRECESLAIHGVVVPPEIDISTRVNRVLRGPEVQSRMA